MDLSQKNIRPVPWWHSIRWRLIFLFIALLGISLIVFNLFSIRMFKSLLLGMGRERNLDLAQRINTEVELSIETLVRDLSSLSRIWPREGENISDRRAEMERLMDRNEDILSLAVADIRGDRLLQISEQGSVPVDPYMDQFQDERIEAILEGNIYIAHVHPASQILPVVDISIPIRSVDPGEVRGILTAVVSLKGIYKRLGSVRLKNGQDLYIVDSNGQVVAYFSHQKDQNASGISGMVPFWGNLRHLRKVQQYMSGIREESLSAPLVYENLQQERVLGVLSICPELKWGIIVEESLHILLEPMTHLIRKNIFIAGIVFVFLIFLAILFLGYILSPLLRLYRLTEGLEQGLKRIGIRGRDEIGRIGQNVDRLIKDLSQKNEHLRRRYKEFEEINHEFEESYDQLQQVTKRLEVSQESLKRERTFTERVIEAADFLIVGMDRNGRVLICNRGCEKKVHYSKEEIVGENWFEIFYPPDARPAVKDRFQKVIQGEFSGIIQDKILTRDGDVLNIEWHTTAIHNKEGLSEGVIMVGEDVTQKRMMEEELRQKNILLSKSNEDLENILSIVSHDLKNPLYILQDFASILLQEYRESLSDDGLYYLERIKVNAEHMEKLIQDLLELSRASRTKGVWQECAVSDLVQKALEEFRELIKIGGIDIKISDGFPICPCEPDRILRVFSNLISNAIKFMQNAKNPKVEIGYRERSDAYEFFVKDNGIGIEKEYHDKIFVIFQRIQDVRDVEGTGVGLTIVKKIVEDHGGRVWVESDKGKGATFYFTISKKIPESTIK